MNRISRSLGQTLKQASRTLLQHNGEATTSASFCQQKRLASSKSQLDVSGIMPPIVTPFDWEEHIYWDKLENNLRLWNKCHFRGYVVQGSNGEYAYLTPEERVEMVRKMRDMTPADKLIIAGSGCESTQETIAMTKKMADAGADAVLVVTPCYYMGQMTNAALEKHYTKVADASPVPVLLYNVTANTGIDMSAEVIIKLSRHANIIGLKDSNGDVAKLGNIVYNTRENDFQVLAGSASFLYPAMTVGCVGGVCALANVLGHDVCQLGSHFNQGKLEDARLLQQRLVAPNIWVTKKYGVPGLKAAMDWFGYYGGPCRSPLQSLTEEQITDVKEAFKSSGFLK